MFGFSNSTNQLWNYPICGKLSLTDDCPCKRIAKTNCVKIVINSLYSVMSNPFWELNGKYSVELRIACVHLAEYSQTVPWNRTKKMPRQNIIYFHTLRLLIIIISSIRNLWIVFI